MIGLNDGIGTRAKEAPQKARFPLGQLVATSGAVTSVSEAEMGAALARHQTGDWGLVDEEDWTANDRALKKGTRLLSAYRTKAGVRYWINAYSHKIDNLVSGSTAMIQVPNGNREN